MLSWKAEICRWICLEIFLKKVSEISKVFSSKIVYTYVISKEGLHITNQRGKDDENEKNGTMEGHQGLRGILLGQQ